MKITVTEEKKVHISSKEMKRIAIKVLMDTYGLHEEMFIKDGNIVREWEQSAGSHSFFEIEVIRKATKKDKMVFEIIKDIRS